MTTALRPNWRTHSTPFDMPMPDDGKGTPLHGAYPQVHEDLQDCINEDGTHGPPNVGEGGGSGIVYGYSVADIDNVVRLEAATHARTDWYNWEHWIRQIRYAIALSDMSRSLPAQRRVLEYANHARAEFDGDGYFYDGPGWTPSTFSQWLHQAQLHPHTALPGNGIPGGSANLRVIGWLLYGEAAALKVHPARSPAFAKKGLDMLALAAVPQTGQLLRDANTGGGQLDQTDVQHTDHWAMCAMGAMACCKRLALPVPTWVTNGMLSLIDQPKPIYGGYPSMWCFQRTVNGVLVPATGPGQQPAPAHGWWSNLCAVQFWMTGNPIWRERAPLFGPTKNLDEQSRKQTMLARGLGW